MHLVKWFRKNMTKLMAVFVILIMIAFIMPTVLQQLSKPRSVGLENAMWLYGKDKKITINEMRQATTELAVLRGLYVNRFLLGQQDLKLILLGQLLFPETVPAATLSDELKKMAVQDRYYISPSRIDDFFSQSHGRPELYWIGLKYEASQAGCAVPSSRAGEILNLLIPQVTNNQLDAATAVKRICSANGMTDEQGLAAFAEVLSIVVYSRIVSDAENITESQMENMFARAKEKISAEFVPFKAEDFLDKASEPDNAQIAAQFEKYKNYLPNTISEDNPYGFGYKQMPRISLDYMIIKLEDVKKLVTKPTEEEVENYYQHNLERFTEQIPVDANDPNSKTVTKQRSYAEVADAIKEGLYAQKVNSQGTKILNKAIEQAESKFESLDLEKMSAEEIKSKAGDYTAAAESSSKEFNVKIYTGRTALLSAEEIQSNKDLGALRMTGQSRTPIRLTRLAFAVKQLGSETSKLSPFDPPVPKIYVSFGPLSDTTGNIMAVVRIVDTAGSAVPADIGFSYQRNLPEISEAAKAENKVFVLKDNVIKDCKRIGGLKFAEDAAKNFLETVKKQSWDDALAKINGSSGKKDKTEPIKKTFEIQTWNEVGKVSQMDIEAIKIRIAGSTSTENIVNQAIIYGKLINAFYSKYEDMQAKNEKPPTIIEFEPQLSCYAVKSLSCSSVTIDEYQKVRQQLAFQQDYLDSQSMAIEHFMPENILKRLNLKPVREPNKPGADSNDINAGENS
jgi:hypothetical protein